MTMLVFDPPKMTGYAAMPAYASMPAAMSASVSANAPSKDAGGEDFFHRVLDIVNPLQHLPVVGTLYRAITGEHIGTVEKIAGDALYGGLWGAVGSIADVAFEAATGKDFGGTMLSLVTGGGDTATGVADATPHQDFGDRLWAMLTGGPHDISSAVAQTRITAPIITADASLPSAATPALPASSTTTMLSQNASSFTLTDAGMDVSALTNALSARGVDSDTASRALYAYRRSMGIAAPQPVVASRN